MLKIERLLNPNSEIRKPCVVSALLPSPSPSPPLLLLHRCGGGMVEEETAHEDDRLAAAATAAAAAATGGDLGGRGAQRAVDGGQVAAQEVASLSSGAPSLMAPRSPLTPSPPESSPTPPLRSSSSYVSHE